MFSGTVALIIICVCCVLGFVSFLQLADNLYKTPSPYWFIPLGLAAATLVVSIIGVSHAFSRHRPDAKACYDIKDVGIQTERVQAAYVDGQLFDVTHRFSVTLDNPEAYCLEKQTYKYVCNGWCLFTIDRDPTYKVVVKEK